MAYLKKRNFDVWLQKNRHLDVTRPYAPGKWNVLQVLRHVTDAERVYQFRALWIARNTPNPLPGFDQDQWAAWYGHLNQAQQMRGLMEEYQAVRSATLKLLASFSAEDLQRQGMANNTWFSPEILVRITAGHEKLHIQTLEKHLS